MSTEVKANPCKVRTGIFRVSFPHLDKPQPGMKPGDPAKFGLVMLFPKDSPDLAPLKAAASVAKERKWGQKVPSGLRSPFRDGNEKDTDGYKDQIYITAASEDAPGVIDQLKNALDPKKVYAGCYARATVVFSGYDKAGNKGVGCYLHNVQFVKHGEPFGSKRQAEDDFDEIEGEDDGEPVTAGAKKPASEPNW